MAMSAKQNWLIDSCQNWKRFAVQIAF
jgi:hypothetical protein